MRTTVTGKRYWSWSALLVVLLLGTGLRFYRLDAQSFWNDEGNTARLVERTIPLIIAGAGGDIHPPGYYLLLHGWQKLAGNSEFALRSFSALAGILTVAVTAALGQKGGGRLTALGAAFGLACQPLAIYYSQEARMYALLGLLAALTLWAAAQFFDGERVALFWLWLTLSLGLYTHYAYAFVILGINMAFLGVWLSQRPLRWRVLRNWIFTQLLAAVTFLPWLPHLFNVASWRPPDLDPGGALQEMTYALLTGITLPAEEGGYLLPVAVLLLGLALWRRSRAPFIKWSAFLMSVLPLGLIAAGGIYRPAYLKFLLVSSAPLAVLLALPLSKCQRSELPRCSFSRCLIVLLLFGAWLPPQITALHNLYFEPQYARADYRGIAARIAARAGPRDGIILSAPNQWEVFTYYYQGALTVYPAPYHPTPEVADAWSDELLQAAHPRLFVLYWGDGESDPERRIERRLAERTYKIQESWVYDLRLAQYGTALLPESPEVQSAAQIGADIHLEGYSLAGQSTFTAGEIVPVTLFWRSDRSLDERLKVFIHLVGADGVPVAQTDAEPVGGLHSTDNWTGGERIIDRHGILLPPELPAGNYTLQTGLYRFSGERLSITRAGEPNGETLMLGEIMVNAE
ncbi:MAG TPA: hypothetical protein G4N98_00640 [Thermoflexia bacterium]|nr:hypothetical protein [Thermoflexia bacterium]